MDVNYNDMFRHWFILTVTQVFLWAAMERAKDIWQSTVCLKLSNEIFK